MLDLLSRFKGRRNGIAPSPSDERFQRGTRSVADLIAPAAIEASRSHLMLDGRVRARPRPGRVPALRPPQLAGPPHRLRPASGPQPPSGAARLRGRRPRAHSQAGRAPVVAPARRPQRQDRQRRARGRLRGRGAAARRPPARRGARLLRQPLPLPAGADAGRPGRPHPSRRGGAGRDAGVVPSRPLRDAARPALLPARRPGPPGPLPQPGHHAAPPR